MQKYDETESMQHTSSESLAESSGRLLLSSELESFSASIRDDWDTISAPWQIHNKQAITTISCEWVLTPLHKIKNSYKLMSTIHYTEKLKRLTK